MFCCFNQVEVGYFSLLFDRVFLADRSTIKYHKYRQFFFCENDRCRVCVVATSSNRRSSNEIQMIHIRLHCLIAFNLAF